MKGDSIEYGVEEFDLLDETTIALTVQAFDLTSIPSVKAATSNKLSLPGTQKNHRLLGYPNIEASDLSSTIKQVLKNITLKSAGLPTLTNCLLDVDSFDGEFYNALLTSSGKNFWDAINDKFLSDLDFSAINGLWDNARRDTQRSNTTNLSSAIIQVGQMTAGSPVNNFTNGFASPPVIYLSYIMDQIFALAGFNKTGPIFGDAAYLRTVIPCTFQYDSKWLRTKEFTAAADGTQVQPFAGGAFVVRFQNVQSQGSDNFYNPATGLYTVVNADTALNYFSCGFSAKIDLTITGGGTVNIELQKNGVTIASVAGVGTSSNVIETISTGYASTKGFKNGDVVRVFVTAVSGTPSVTILASSTFTAKCFESSDTVKAFEESWYHYFNALLPPISLKQIMAELITMNGLLSKSQETDGSINFQSYESIVLKTPIDWTKKFKTNIKTLQSYNPNAARNNYFNWKAGDLAVEAFQGNMQVTSDKLPLNATQFQSQFEIGNMTAISGISVASIPTFAGGVFTNLTNVRARFAMVRPTATNEPSVRFDLTGRTDYYVVYFNDPGLDWGNIVASKYKSYALALNNYRMVEKQMTLSTLDISSFDPFTPITIGPNKYIVNKIYQFIRGRLTKVQLFKI